MPVEEKEALENMTFVDATVVNRNTLGFTLNYVDPQGREGEFGYKRPDSAREKTLFVDIESRIWAGKQFAGGFRFGKSAAGRTPDGYDTLLFADSGGHVVSFAFPDGPRQREPNMPVRAVEIVKFIGQHFYSCGLGQGFLKREAAGEWKILSWISVEEEKASGKRAPNFVALDGIAENNIFIAQQKKDHSLPVIQHWDGERLTPIALPKEVTTKHREEFPMQITALTVAPDGQVYVAGSDGELLVGGREGFMLLTDDNRKSIRFGQMCWFKGTLYGGHDMGLFAFDFDELCWKGAPFIGDNEMPIGGPHLDANEDIMVLAGPYTAGIFDGEKWTRIAGDVTPLDVTRLQLMEQQVQDLADLTAALRDVAQGD